MAITPKSVEEIMKEFDNDLMDCHPGDSGSGGNYPQEPGYDYACEPQEMRNWLRSALASHLLWAAGETWPQRPMSEDPIVAAEVQAVLYEHSSKIKALAEKI